MSEGIGTLLDISKLSTDVPAKVVQTIIDCMPLFDQMAFVPANNGMNNKTLVVTDYPEGQLRGFNEGVKPEKAGGMTVTDSTAMLSTYSQIDAKLLQLNKNSAEWRYNQEQAFQVGIAHNVAKMIFQGSLKKDPKAFDGLLTRYAKKSDKDVFLDAGGTSSATKGLGDEQDCYDKNGRRFRGVVTDYDWTLGLAVEDRRQVVRVGNIDIGGLTADAKTGKDLVDLLIDAVEMFPTTVGAGCAIYMNKALRTMLRKQIGHRENVNLQWETVAGRKVVTYDGIPVHKLPESILPTYSTPIS